MTEHTPTPWRVIAGDDYYIAADAYPKEFIGHFKSDDTGDYVAWMGNRPKDFSEANAAHIVKCVNAHDEAIALLELASISLWRKGENAAAREIDKFLDRVSPSSRESIDGRLSAVGSPGERA